MSIDLTELLKREGGNLVVLDKIPSCIMIVLYNVVKEGYTVKCYNEDIFIIGAGEIERFQEYHERLYSAFQGLSAEDKRKTLPIKMVRSSRNDMNVPDKLLAKLMGSISNSLEMQVIFPAMPDIVGWSTWH